MEKIKSKYCALQAFNFIGDINFKYKLFLNSKYYQKKFDLKLFDYKEIYINLLRINFDNYLSFNNIATNNFDKEILRKNFEQYNLDINEIKENIINYFKKYLKSNIEKSNDFQFITYKHYLKPISIYSPFFEILSKTSFFDEIFTIQIPIKVIEKYNLEKDYISAFEILNKANTNYSSIFIKIKDANDINYFNQFKISTQNIKCLTIKKEKNDNINNYDYFLTNFFNAYNINNIVYLNLESFTKTICQRDYILLNNLNKFKSLEILALNNFYFEQTFPLFLSNLKVLNISFCSKIDISNICLNLKKLYLIFSHISMNHINILKFPKIEDFCLNIGYKKDWKFLDFNSFNNLKRVISNSDDFIRFQNTNIEYAKIRIDYYNNNPIEIEKNMLIKILSIKTLKEVDFGLNDIDNEEIWKIPVISDSIIKTTIYWNSRKNDCIINNLLKKFPNLISLTLYTIKIQDSNTKIEIEENPTCKIKKMSLTVGGPSINQLYCQSFESLIEFELNINNEIINLKESIPFCNANCKTIFNSLIDFKFSTNSPYLIDFEILNNIYLNIDKMPKIKNFYIKCIVKDINEDFIKKFIIKLLSLRLEYIKFEIQDNKNNFIELYSYFELKKLCPNIKTLKLENIFISKFK